MINRKAIQYMKAANLAESTLATFRRITVRQQEELHQMITEHETTIADLHHKLDDANAHATSLVESIDHYQHDHKLVSYDRDEWQWRANEALQNVTILKDIITSRNVTINEQQQKIDDLTFTLATQHAPTSQPHIDSNTQHVQSVSSSPSCAETSAAESTTLVASTASIAALELQLVELKATISTLQQQYEQHRQDHDQQMSKASATIESLTVTIGALTSENTTLQSTLDHIRYEHDQQQHQHDQVVATLTAAHVTEQAAVHAAMDAITKLNDDHIMAMQQDHDVAIKDHQSTNDALAARITQLEANVVTVTNELKATRDDHISLMSSIKAEMALIQANATSSMSTAVAQVHKANEDRQNLMIEIASLRSQLEIADKSIADATAAAAVPPPLPMVISTTGPSFPAMEDAHNRAILERDQTIRELNIRATSAEKSATMNKERYKKFSSSLATIKSELDNEKKNSELLQARITVMTNEKKHVDSLIKEKEVENVQLSKQVKSPCAVVGLCNQLDAYIGLVGRTEEESYECVE
jgi:DNA repair exonuclease SbcCD ATPase subunit